MDLTKMTIEELHILQKAIGSEIACREKIRERELWKNVVTSIQDYEKEFGSIQFETSEETAYIVRFDDPGYISLTFY